MTTLRALYQHIVRPQLAHAIDAEDYGTIQDLMRALARCALQRLALFLRHMRS